MSTNSDLVSPKYAVAYYRCSGHGQVDGDTWDRQAGSVEAYARNNGFELSKHFRDEGVTGTSELEGREGLTELMHYIEERAIKFVLVESADRIARDLLVAEILIREFQKLGVTVIAASGGVDLTSGNDLNPTGKLIRQILSAIAEWDRCVTVNKLKVARDRKRAATGRCEGRKPFGALEGESPILDTMLLLHSEGMSAAMIASQLQIMGYHPRHGRNWNPAVVQRILARHRILPALHTEGYAAHGFCV